MVVVGEVQLRHRHRPDRRQRHALDRRGEPVPEPTEPAPADGRARRRLGAGDPRQPIEHRERIAAGDVVGADDRPAAQMKTIAPPPAHAPVSANGSRSPATAWIASAAVQSHRSGSRISVAWSCTGPDNAKVAPVRGSNLLARTAAVSRSLEAMIDRLLAPRPGGPRCCCCSAPRSRRRGWPRAAARPRPPPSPRAVGGDAVTGATPRLPPAAAARRPSRCRASRRSSWRARAWSTPTPACSRPRRCWRRSAPARSAASSSSARRLEPRPDPRRHQTAAGGGRRRAPPTCRCC